MAVREAYCSYVERTAEGANEAEGALWAIYRRSFMPSWEATNPSPS